MASEYYDAARAARYQRFEFDFPARTLTGRVVLAPGGAGGLGAATTALLVAEGARVILGYQGNKKRAEALAAILNAGGPGRVECVAGDLRHAEARIRLVEAGLRAGELYALVSFLGDPARLGAGELSEASLTDSLATNCLAPLLLARQVGERMNERGVAGSIVFLSTMQAVAPFAGSLNYAVPKAALAHAARILAREWPAVRVNVVAPGVMAAGMAVASIEKGKYDGYVRDGIIPRFGRPEDVARVVLLLLEPDNYLTGQVITVDGGLTARRG